MPYCERNKYFDFLVWDGPKKYLYVFQITIDKTHKKSDELFFADENLNQYCHISKNQIKFLWITLKDIDLSNIMNEGSFLIKYEKETINKMIKEK